MLVAVPQVIYSEDMCNIMPPLWFIPLACIWLGRQLNYTWLVIIPLYLPGEDLHEMIWGTLRFTGIIVNLYSSCYLVVRLFDAVCLIPLMDVRPVYILNPLPYLRAKYVLQWTHSSMRIYERVAVTILGGLGLGQPGGGALVWWAGVALLKANIGETYQTGVHWFGEG